MLIAYIKWDVDPVIFEIGILQIRWYSMMFLIGFLIAIRMLKTIFIREKTGVEHIDKAFYYLFLSTLIGARLGHVLFYDPQHYLVEHPEDIIKVWEGGLASHGGTIAVVLAMWYFARKVLKKPAIWLFDRLAYPVALVAGLIRLGNLFNSEIYGVETKLPWGFIFLKRRETLPHHPTQLYEALCYFSIFWLCRKLYRQGHVNSRPGLLFGIFMLGIFGTRFLIEFIKNNQEAWEEGMALNMGQLLSAPFILLGGLVIYLSWTTARSDRRLQNDTSK